MKVFTLKKRKYFVEAAKGYKVVTNGIILQAASVLSKQDQPDFPCCYCGYTATKKLGKAHIRNYVKRRLRAIARNILSKDGISGFNYVFIGRHNTASLDYSYLQRKASQALLELNQQIQAINEQSNDKKINDNLD